ncbi:MAG TPA: hypothetical protein PKJ36_11665, partial [Flavihumibacter sp.]|nr:hypothetical protein [Flavihumibacter sp.]
AANIANLYGTISVYNSVGTLIYNCNNLPLTTSGTIRKLDFSIPTLNAIAACGGYPNTKFNNGDSVVINAYYKINSNPGSVLAPVNISNAFYVSNMANPLAANRYSCGGTYNGNLFVVGWGGGSSGNLTYSIMSKDSAKTQAMNVGLLGPCCTTAGASLSHLNIARLLFTIRWPMTFRLDMIFHLQRSHIPIQPANRNQRPKRC